MEKFGKKVFERAENQCSIFELKAADKLMTSKSDVYIKESLDRGPRENYPARG